MPRFRTLAFLLAPLVAAACSDATTGPADTAALSHTISSSELGQALDTAPARLEIKLERGTLVAREIELKTSDEMSDEESVRGLVTAVATSAGTGTLTFEIGGLAVTFTSSARFRDDNADGDLTLDEFVARIETALAAGIQPMVRAKRPAAAEPQAADDATFQATDLRIRDGADSPKIELNVDADNFEANDAPPPEAWLHVLGITIEIRSTTEVQADDDDHDETEVQGLVASVDVAGGSVTLTNGTVILVPEAGAFDDDGDDDDGDDLTSLQAVADALAAGQAVEAEAEGAVQSTNPLTILAREVEFEVEDDGGDDDGDDGQQGQGFEFGSAVQSADAAAGFFVLSSGATVRITDATAISGFGDLLTLEAVANALATGKPVRAEGRAVVESSGPPVTLVALTVKWEVDD